LLDLGEGLDGLAGWGRLEQARSLAEAAAVLSVEWTGRPMSMSMSMSLTSLCCRSGCQTEGVRVVSQLMVVDGECSNKQPLAALA